MDSPRFDAFTQHVSGRLTRRTGLGVLAGASLPLFGLSEATDAKKKKKVTLCVDGKTVSAPKKKAKKLLQQGATKGACVVTTPPPRVCPAGQRTCGSGCIPAGDCCVDTDCTGDDFCQNGECVAPPCGAGGPCIVFVSSSATIGKFTGGLAGADVLCQTASDNNPDLDGRTFKAWLSDEGDTPSARFSNVANSGPYVLVGDSGAAPVVAETFFDLLECSSVFPFLCLLNPINRTETGSTEVSTTVWTGTNRSGTVATGNTCDSWTDDTETALIGNTGSKNGDWTEASPTVSCGSATRALYCFEQAV